MEQEAVKRTIATQKCSPDPGLVKQRRTLSIKWATTLTKAIRNSFIKEKQQYMEDLATGQISTHNVGEEDIITLDRVSIRHLISWAMLLIVQIFMQDADLASRPSFTLIDAPSIELPADENERAVIGILFDSTDKLHEAYDLLSKDGPLSKRKVSKHGVMEARATLAAMEADKAILIDEDDLLT